MIFVTVGTHEQPFNRLVKKIDELKGNGTIQDDVFIQTGFSTYEPKNCQWSKLIPYNQMIKNVEKCILCSRFSGQFVNIVQDKYIDQLVEMHKIIDFILPYRFSKLSLEQIRRYI